MIQAGTYLIVNDKSYLVTIVGKAPFLTVKCIIDFDAFENGELKIVNDEEISKFVQNPDDFIFHNINTIKSEVTEQFAETAELNDLEFTAEELKKYCGMYRNLGENQFTIKVMTQTGYGMPKVKLIIKKVKLHLEQSGFTSAEITAMGAMDQSQIIDTDSE